MLYDIKVQLREIEPPIWRRLRVPSRTSLARLHKVLQDAMGWKNYHLYLFHVEGKHYGEPSTEWDIDVQDSSKLPLEKIFLEGQKSFLYEYDLGDSWIHEITLLDIVEREEKLGCTAGARACILKTAAVFLDTTICSEFFQIQITKSTLTWWSG